MKKILALVLVIALVLTLFAACGGGKDEEAAQPASDKKVIGIILIDLTNQFFIDMVEGGDEEAKD